MSCYMCEDAMFDALAAFAHNYRDDSMHIPFDAPYKQEAMEKFGIDASGSARVLLPAHTAMVAAILRDANARSVEFRYEDCKTSNAMGTKDVYRYRPVSVMLTPVQALAALRCYEYQSCEPDNWTDSLAYAIVQALRDIAINRLTADVSSSVTEEQVRPDFDRARRERAAAQDHKVPQANAPKLTERQRRANRKNNGEN